ncbi:spore germination protein [Paenibacillus sp. H1-7]|uniref:spore germination protein n=1 Tax=Paenibacillus sp. H1-7 TaxID=2282849 RepID=UPI001EF8CA0F|nr:spore germination protein [Paenibacillus sp. H1-7]ULL18144.1 spore germination protein [Paenibacillus sp. H1-7]
MSELWLDRIFPFMSKSDDFVWKTMSDRGFLVQYFYLVSMIDAKQLDSLVLPAIISSQNQEELQTKLLSLGSMISAKEPASLDHHLLDGTIIVRLDNALFTIPAKKIRSDQPEDMKVEQTLLGPQKSLSESIDANLGIIRSRYPNVELRAEPYVLGTLTKTRVLMLYDQSRVKPELLEEVQTRLSRVQFDIFQSVTQLEIGMNNRRLSLFPRMLVTERPDRIVLNLAKGKVVIMVDGTPFTLIAPAVFYDFMSAMDDLYQSFWVARALVLLRYLALFLTITLPAIYISIVSFNPDITRVQLTLSIAGSRAAVPYPSYVEVLIMMFLTEALTEASLRLPKYIGSTATTVGGLILGQAAQQAGLVSSIMIIITSAVAISNFVIPINVMSYSVRILKYVFIIFASFFGIVGTAVGLFCLIGHMANMRSFGEPYLKLFIGEAAQGRPIRTK